MQKYIVKAGRRYTAPEVKKPEVNYWGGINQEDADRIHEQQEAYNTWEKQSLPIPEQYHHLFEKGKEYPESAFRVEKHIRFKDSGSNAIGQKYTDEEYEVAIPTFQVQNLLPQIEYPTIQADSEKITITITKDILINAIEGRPDAQYKVVEPDRLLERFAYHLANYSESNAVEIGLNELQYLFDRVTDELYTSAEDIIIDLNENL